MGILTVIVHTNYTTMNSDTAQLLAALAKQEELLKRLITVLDKPKMGFADRPPGQPQWVFIGRTNGSCWYSLDKDSIPVPIEYKALTGFLFDLKFEKVVRRNKETYKLNVTVKTDSQTYILSSGHDTCFSKSLLTSLAILKPEQLRQPVTIVVAPGEDESIVWCRLYAPEYIKAPQWEADTDFRPIAESAISNINAANMPF